MAANELKILAIDDNRDNLTTLQAVVAERLPGARVLTALNGKRGLELARGEDPDVILLDIVMPVMDGYDVCRQLKADESLRGIPVLFLTALRTDMAGRIAAMEAGAEGFLSKPFDEIELLAQIRAMAKIKAANRQKRQEKAELEALVADRTHELERELAERKRAEGLAKALLLSVENEKTTLSALIASISDEVWFADAQRKFTLANPTALAQFGIAMDQDVPVEQLAGSLEVLRPDGSPRSVEEAPPLRALAGEVVLNQEEIVRVPATGELRSRLVNATPVRDAAGTIIGAVAVVRDITERKKAESLIRDTRLFLEMTINSIADPVFVKDDTRRFVLVNDALCAMVGRPRESLLGDDGDTMFPADQVAVFRKIDTGVLETGVESSNEEDLSDLSSGEVRTIVTRKTRFTDQAGRRFLVGVIRDITKLRQAEAGRVRISEERAHLEDQLRQAQKVEAIGRLAGGVAHDFNNITAIILGYAELLLGQLGPQDPSRQWAEQIVLAANRSAALTRQLLAFSRKQVLLPVVLDLNALLRDLEKLLGRAIGEDIDLKLLLGANPGRITADPGQIGQVVTNIVLNARDAMPKGGSLTVETADVELDETYQLDHESVVPGSYVMLAVTDSGCGMDKATMAHLFEPFFTTKERGKGTGLGLASSFGIVKQSGGYLWAYSEPGRGTTFKIYLPRTDAALSTTGAETGAGGAAVLGDGEMILLVEDETGLRELCETVLVRLGYRVSAAGNGPEALRQVRELGLEPDLVLTDVIMPGMSGPELADHLRNDRPDLKVLYMSGYPDEAISRHGILNPGIPFIPKPFTEHALAVKVRKVLGMPALGKKAAPVNPGAAAQTAPAEKTEVGPAAGKTAVPTTRRVLMVDDDEQYRELVGHFCTKRGHVFAGVDSVAAALAALAGSAFDVLFVDLNIPGTSGEHVLQEIRAAGHAAPAIILTGDVSSADMAVLGPLGAVLALEKTSNGEPLLRAIAAAVTVVNT